MQMRSGTIELNSGRWHWLLIPRWSGAMVLFQHWERLHDEMRSWTPAEELSNAGAREVARDSQYRTWVDADGMKWRLSFEIPAGWRRDAEGEEAGGDSSIWLVFRMGSLHRQIAVSDQSRLGDFSHKQLSELLDRASALALESEGAA